MAKIASFQDLEAWQSAHRFTLRMYKATSAFPPNERYGLVSQIRRAAVSISANIAEGFKRQGIRDKIRFYNISEGSLEETKYFLILSRDLGYLTSFEEHMQHANQVGRLLNGLIASTKRRL